MAGTVKGRALRSAAVALGLALGGGYAAAAADAGGSASPDTGNTWAG